MIKTPPYLQPGDTIGIVCPGGYMPLEKMRACIHAFRDWGYQVRTGHTAGAPSDNYFSGSDEERLADLQLMLDDDPVKAVLCGRGGYGLTRIIDRLDFKRFRSGPKWIIGFSDITLLHAHIHAHYGISTIHGPMAGAFNGQDPNSPFLLSLKNALEGKPISYSCEAHPLNRKGPAMGELVGGNLALLAHGIGTSSDIVTKGKILFLEDVGEYLYNIDRMLRQLRRAGKFAGLAGLIVGSFTDMKDTARPFGRSVYEIVREAVEGYDFPVCFGFPVGHARENLALRTGMVHALKVGRSKVSLSGAP